MLRLAVPSLNDRGRGPGAGNRHGPRRGWTFVELMVVLVLVAVALLIGTLSVYRGKSAAEQLTCQDNMRAIRSALDVYYVKNNRTLPADQAAFEAFLQSRTYFSTSSTTSAVADELRCPLDENHAYHYQYSRNPTTDVIIITCPVPGSGHGAM